MCQILYSDSTNPPKDAIVDANHMNQDGFGYAWVQDKTVKWSKGFSKEELTDDVIEYYLSLSFPKAIHFRLATHGGKTQELTHPFPIKRGVPHDLQGEAKAVLFHNGVWHEYDDVLRHAILSNSLNPNCLKGGMSDSRAMAVLAQRYGIDFLDLLNLSGQKVLILAANGTTRWGSWTEKEGWSASSSKIFRTSDTGKGSGGTVHKGVALGPAGLPLSPEEQARLGRLGHLNRHGNLRSKFRGGSSGTAQRDVGTETREMDAARESAGRLTQSSLYLDATIDEIKQMQGTWGAH